MRALVRRLRHGAARRLVRALGPVARGLWIDLAVHDFYSPVPDLRQLPRDTFERPLPLQGIEFEPARHLEFLERNLAGYVREFTPPSRGAGGPHGFFLDNGTYGAGDAEVLYAMIRWAKPARVIELGSGFSSLVLGAAGERNAAEGDPVDYRCFDPYPRSDLEAAIRSVTALEPISATDVPLARFEALEAGDVLFVDTTHTVKVAGDVNHIVLDVLPLLADGVLVHFHDIFLPHHYPRDYIEHGYYWAEQYLLQAFLAFNPAFEVIYAAHAVADAHPGRMTALIESVTTESRATAFWLRRSGAAMPRRRV